MNATAYFDHFSLDLPVEAIADCSHPGDCDDDVAHWHSSVDFSHITDSDLAAELREYGAWNDDQLQDRDDNEQRLLWIAAGNLQEELVAQLAHDD